MIYYTGDSQLIHQELMTEKTVQVIKPSFNQGDVILFLNLSEYFMVVVLTTDKNRITCINNKNKVDHWYFSESRKFYIRAS